MRTLLPTLLMLCLSLPAVASTLNPANVFFDFRGTQGENPPPNFGTQRPQSFLRDFPRLRFYGQRRVVVAGDRGREEFKLAVAFGTATFVLRTPDHDRFDGHLVGLGSDRRKVRLALPRAESARYIEAAVRSALGNTDLREVRVVGAELELVAKVNRDGDKAKLRGAVRFTVIRDGERVEGSVKLRGFAKLG